MRPDFYIAAIGRSGSTLLCNWLTRAPHQLVFNEPFFCRRSNSRLLRIQLANFGMAASAGEWREREETAEERFERIMAKRLEDRRWAFKEVLYEEHEKVLAGFAPPKIVITLRNIADAALSFFEKHRTQDNLDRFDDEWVTRYCIRESAGIVQLTKELDARRIPRFLLRYEDFIQSEQARKAVQNFLGWTGGGEVAAHFHDFDRGFEIDRHGSSISPMLRTSCMRDLGDEQFRRAQAIAERCSEYQRQFGYAA